MPNWNGVGVVILLFEEVVVAGELVVAVPPIMPVQTQNSRKSREQSVPTAGFQAKKSISETPVFAATIVQVLPLTTK